MKFNEAKELLNMGIFPCIISSSGYIDYICSYDESNTPSCNTLFNDISFLATTTNSELSINNNIIG